MTTKQIQSRKVELKAVIEGMKDYPIPVSQVSVNASPGQPATAEVLVPAVKEAMEIPGRTLISIFFRDPASGDQAWRLLFCGQLLQDNIAYDRSPTISWLLADLSHHYVSLPLVIQTGLSMYVNLFDPAQQSVQLQSRYMIAKKSHALSYQQYLASHAKYFSTMTIGLQKFIRRAFEDNPNEWFNSVIWKVRKLDKIIYGPSDRLIQRVFGITTRNLFLQFAQSWQSSVEFVTLWQVIMQFLRSTAYNLYPNPCAPYYEKFEIKGFKEDYGPGLGLNLALPDVMLGPPPKCNVIFPEMILGMGLPRYKVPVTRYCCIFTNPNFMNYPVVAGAWPKAGDHPWKTSDLFGWERFTGPNALVEPLSPEYNVLAKANIEQYGVNIHQFAEYMAMKKQLANRIATVSLTFDPYIVPGMPVLILVEYQGKILPHIGMALSVDHRVSTFGPSTTSLRVAYCHVLSEDLALGIPNVSKDGTGIELVAPLQGGENDWQFFEEIYTDLIYGQARSAFGSCWVGDMNQLTKITEDLSQVKDLSDTIHGPMYRKRAYIYRPIATEDQVLNFFFAGEFLEGNYANVEEFQGAAKTAANKLIGEKQFSFGGFLDTIFYRCYKALQLYAALKNPMHFI